MIVVRSSPGKGRGIFATRRIAAGSVIEEAPVISMPAGEIEHLEKIALQDYYFLWGPEMEEAALPLGLCTLCNHSFDANARFVAHHDRRMMGFVALRDIEAGEEVTINYNGHPASQRHLWFEVLP